MHTETRTFTRTEEVTVYVSEDGESYETEKECLMYEAKDKLETKLITEAIPYGDYLSSDELFYSWYLIDSKETAELFNTAFDKSIVYKDKPYIVCIGYNDWDLTDSGFDRLFYLSEQLKDLNSWLNPLGYEVKKIDNSKTESGEHNDP